jgi:hypothetical protein
MMSSIWTLSTGSAIRAISLAREAELLLVRDDNQTIYLITAKGSLQAQMTFSGLAAACASDDGSALAAVGAAGQVWWLAPDLTTRWERAVPTVALAVATDPFGQYLAVADKRGGLTLFDRTGRTLGRTASPRPIHHLAFVPTQPYLAATADLGWAGLFDLTTGQWVWTDRPVSNIGSLAVSGNGDAMLLACFSEGIRRYSPAGPDRHALKLPKPGGLVALSFAGEIGVAAGGGRELYGFNAKGSLTFTRELPYPPTALAIAALGGRAIAGFADGRVTTVDLAPA